MIAGAFGLRIRAVSQLESYGNENWLVEAEGGQRYVVRRQHLNADPRRIAFQFSLQRHLAACAVPTPAAIATASGQPFAAGDDGVPWLVFDHIAGDEYGFERPAQAFQAARTLAHFHRAAASFAFDAPRPELRAALRACWSDAFSDLAEMATLLGEGSGAGLSVLRAWWQRTLQTWPPERVDALPTGWMHGDFHGRNMVFRGDAVAALFDFDDVDRGPYAYDVAFGLVKFSRPSRVSLRLRSGFARAFIEGYESVRRLTAEERAALPLFASMPYPPHPLNLRYWRDRRGEDIALRFSQEIAIIRQLAGEVERIVPELFG